MSCQWLFCSACVTLILFKSNLLFTNFSPIVVSCNTGSRLRNIIIFVNCGQCWLYIASKYCCSHYCSPILFILLYFSISSHAYGHFIRILLYILYRAVFIVSVHIALCLVVSCTIIKLCNMNMTMLQYSYTVEPLLTATREERPTATKRSSHPAVAMATVMLMVRFLLCYIMIHNQYKIFLSIGRCFPVFVDRFIGQNLHVAMAMVGVR